MKREREKGGKEEQHSNSIEIEIAYLLPMRSLRHNDSSLKWNNTHKIINKRWIPPDDPETLSTRYTLYKMSFFSCLFGFSFLCDPATLWNKTREQNGHRFLAMMSTTTDNNNVCVCVKCLLRVFNSEKGVYPICRWWETVYKREQKKGYTGSFFFLHNIHFTGGMFLFFWLSSLNTKKWVTVTQIVVCHLFVSFFTFLFCIVLLVVACRLFQ